MKQENLYLNTDQSRACSVRPANTDLLTKRRNEALITERRQYTAFKTCCVLKEGRSRAIEEKVKKKTDWSEDEKTKWNYIFQAKDKGKGKSKKVNTIWRIRKTIFPVKKHMIIFFYSEDKKEEVYLQNYDIFHSQDKITKKLNDHVKNKNKSK